LILKRNNQNKNLVSDSAETSFGSSFGCFYMKLVSEDTLLCSAHYSYREPLLATVQLQELLLGYSKASRILPSATIQLQGFFALLQFQYGDPLLCSSTATGTHCSARIVRQQGSSAFLATIQLRYPLLC
jgi:hypothetical protein